MRPNIQQAAFYLVLVSWIGLAGCGSDAVGPVVPGEAQWVQTSGPGGGRIQALITGPGLFAGADDDGVFRSTDDGASWTEFNTGLTNTEVLALQASGTNLFVGTRGGGAWRRSF